MSSTRHFELPGTADLAAAAATWEEKLLRAPNLARAWHGLGLARAAQNRLKEAVECFRQTVLLDPSHADAWTNLGYCAGALYRLHEGETAFRRALALRPNHAEAHAGLANVFQRMGRIQDALEQDRLAVAAAPNAAVAYGTMPLAWNSCDRATPQEVFAVHRGWGAIHEAQVSPLPRRPVDAAKARLRVGYLSADFRDHVVWKWLEPVLRHFKRDRYDVVAYSDVAKPDHCTEAAKAMATEWRDISGLRLEEAAALIHRDRIDILVDLAGHTSELVMVMLHRPAPLQVSYLGYPNTTGLTRIDYVITDEHVDPPGATERYYTETLVRLPGCFSCYQPAWAAPDVGGSPAVRQGFVTFGSFNNVSKYSDTTLKLWADVLRCVPGSRLLLKPPVRLEPAVRAEILGRFLPLGIAPDRVELLEREHLHAAHLAMHARLDVALDTYPYHGTTTTCDALWMGVPVVTLAGATHPSRVGVTLLKNVGLDELIAGSEQQYVETAAGLAKDLPRLAALRRGLRDRMIHSPLTDGPRYVARLEEAYELMWREKVGKGKADV